MIKKILCALSAIIMVAQLFGQTTIDSKRLIVRDSIQINGKWIKAILTDTALSAATNRDIVGANAFKNYLQNRLNYYWPGSRIVDSINNLRILANNKLSKSDADSYYPSNARFTDTAAALRSLANSKANLSDSGLITTSSVKTYGSQDIWGNKTFKNSMTISQNLSVLGANITANSVVSNSIGGGFVLGSNSSLWVDKYSDPGSYRQTIHTDATDTVRIGKTDIPLTFASSKFKIKSGPYLLEAPDKNGVFATLGDSSVFNSAVVNTYSPQNIFGSKNFKNPSSWVGSYSGTYMGLFNNNSNDSTAYALQAISASRYHGVMSIVNTDFGYGLTVVGGSSLRNTSAINAWNGLGGDVFRGGDGVNVTSKINIFGDGQFRYINANRITLTDALSPSIYAGYNGSYFLERGTSPGNYRNVISNVWNSGYTDTLAIGDPLYGTTLSGSSLRWRHPGGWLHFPAYANKTLAVTDGTGASGTWGINISGNAGTVTNGLYTTGGTLTGNLNVSNGISNVITANTSGGFTAKRGLFEDNINSAPVLSGTNNNSGGIGVLGVNGASGIGVAAESLNGIALRAFSQGLTPNTVIRSIGGGAHLKIVSNTNDTVLSVENNGKVILKGDGTSYEAGSALIIKESRFEPNVLGARYSMIIKSTPEYGANGILVTSNGDTVKPDGSNLRDGFLYFDDPSGGYWMAGILGGGLMVGSLTTNGTVYSNGGILTNVNPSERRLKNTITPINYGLKEVLRFKPASFYYNRDTLKQSKTYGLIVDEVEPVASELIIYDKRSKNFGIKTEAIPFILIKAVQEQQSIIDSQAKRITELENRLAKIESALTKIVESKTPKTK